jgi:hypothetical protein
VLIVYETQQEGQLKPGQYNAIFGNDFRSLLRTKCAKDGQQPGFWILDKDVDVTNLPKNWQDAWKRPRTSIPWLIISNGKTGYEGPLPEKLEDTVALISKYGG